MNRLICVLWLLTIGLFPLTVFGADQKPTPPRVLAAGDGAAIWVVERKGGDEFQVLHRNEAAEPKAIYRALESKGQPIAAAAGGGKLYLVYSDGTVQSVRFVIDEATRMPRYPSRQLPPLPEDTSLVDIVAGDRGPIVLVRFDPKPKPADTTEPAPADGQAAEPTDAPPPQGPSPEEPSPEAPPEPTQPFALLELDAGLWQTMPVPDGLVVDQRLQLALVGADQKPTIIARAQNGSVLIMHTQGDEGWASQVHARPVSDAFDVVTPMGLCVVIDRVSETTLTCAILRHGEALEAGQLLIPPARQEQLAVSAYRDRPAAVTGDPTQDQLTIASRDLADATDVPSTSQVLSITAWPAPPLNREMMMFALLVVMTVFVLATWRRDPKSGLVELPDGVMPAEISRRALAAVIDMAPPILVGMLLTATSDPMQVLANWPAPAGNWADMTAGFIAIGLFVGHTAITEALTATTLGKKLLGLRIVTVKGESPNLWQVLTRNVLKIIALLVWFPLILIAFNPARQRMGDIAARTVVVRDIGKSSPDR